MLDAHSFAWILSSQMEKEGKLGDLVEVQENLATERESKVKTRVGQEKFRSDLQDYWSVCAVTGCSKLLTASHIKPWAKSSPSERLDPFNGLLLSPALDQCFDAGYISFDNDGEIMISPQLGDQSREAMGIDASMKLATFDNRHKEYLDYHRKHVFK
ncbi:HNH endonuclease [Endozoicomonas montiporae]|uniref:HNH endonuclease n=1 Tax=Endozoicomonas montiporae TaxID=1027273 RepID=UPI001363318D|nr:HNH endonuclease [Endozoicomonas montiporae]